MPREEIDFVKLDWKVEKPEVSFTIHGFCGRH